MRGTVHSRSGFSTRVLLICGALAAVHLMLHLSTVGLLTVLAPISPPLYALVASVHGAMPFLARRLTRTPGTATVTAAAAGVSPAHLTPVLILGTLMARVAGEVTAAAVTGVLARALRGAGVGGRAGISEYR